MIYYLIGGCIVATLIVLRLIVKTIQNLRYKKHLKEDIAWQISRAREMGISLENVRFDDNNSLIDPETGKPIEY
jgi:hypothetical protein